ncbi:MAG TPA: methyltransferase domain-containing protein [Planctomycetota bacterium]
MHENSKLLFARHALPFFTRGVRVLEIGPDHVPSTYQQMVADHRRSDGPAVWETVDLASRPGMTFAATNEYAFPIPESGYDVVVSGQVMEHVRKPWLWMRELARVCRTGGHVVTISPVSWPYHEAPVDCWRAYPEGMRALYEDAGLEVLEARWQTLEPRGLLPRFPRPISDHAPGFLYRLARFLRWPLARAYDAITIGRKPAKQPALAR